jgi:hypothetical protein
MGPVITEFLKAIGPGNDALAVVPRMADNKEYCLSYQCKGKCLKRCRRKAGHRDLSAPETDTLVTFLEEGCTTIGA